MDWFRERILNMVKEEERETGRHQGKAEAYNDVLAMMDPESWCQQCGAHFYDKARRVEHYEKNPGHLPGEPQAKE